MDCNELKAKLLKNNKEISLMLRQNETLLKNAGFNPPEKNFVVEGSDKINIPSGYIRVTTYFSQKYHLNEIIRTRVVRDNITYAFQITDFYNYIINRFYIWGSLQTMFYKDAIITLVSIMEAFISECVNNICNNTKNCTSVNKCKFHFNKGERGEKVFEALKKLKKISIVGFSDIEMERVEEFLSLRNRVHIRLAEENEFNSADFCLEKYNELICLLQRLSDDIYNNGVKYYIDCVE